MVVNYSSSFSLFVVVLVLVGPVKNCGCCRCVCVYLVVAYLAIVYHAVLDCQWTNIQWCRPNPICLECAHNPYFPSSHRAIRTVSAAWHCSVKSIIAQVRLRKPRDGANGLKTEPSATRSENAHGMFRDVSCASIYWLWFLYHKWRNRWNMMKHDETPCNNNWRLELPEWPVDLPMLKQYSSTFVIFSGFAFSLSIPFPRLYTGLCAAISQHWPVQTVSQQQLIR